VTVMMQGPDDVGPVATTSEPPPAAARTAECDNKTGQHAHICRHGSMACALTGAPVLGGLPLLWQSTNHTQIRHCAK
jgi:hypothetical protein